MITPYFPYFSASNCNDLKEAEKWRIQVIREASKKMSQIQNAGLGEFKIRDLNDEINKVPFIYYVSTFIAQNFQIFHINCFFRQIKEIPFSTSHFDEIFIL